MPKPWELDWSAGGPAPDAMPLPIMPFFGRPRAPMLGDGASVIGPASVLTAGPYDVSPVPDAGNAASGMSAEASEAPYGIDPAIPLEMQPAVLSADAIDPSGMSSVARLAGAAGQRIAQPAAYDDWNAAAGQAGTSSGQSPLVLPQDVLRTNGFPDAPPRPVPPSQSQVVPRSNPSANLPSPGADVLRTYGFGELPPPAQRNRSQRMVPGRQQPAPRRANAAHLSTSQLGSLASLREIGQSQPDPGRISSGIGDPGGPSYGTYQLATNPGTAATFATSDEVRRYAPQLAGLRPGTPAFNEEWRRLATRDPEGFQAAQHAFMERTHYRPAVRNVLRSTGLDLEARGDAVRELAWSVADQLHNHAGGIISRAVASVDRSFPRNDARYDPALINAINNERAAPHIRRRDELRRQAQRVNPAAARRLLGRAAREETLIRRWEEERQRAQQMLNGH